LRQKTRVLGYQMVKKSWRWLSSFWHNTGAWQTGRQTDGWTDGQTRCDRYYPR